MEQTLQQVKPAHKNSALRAAFPATVPVLTGYLCLGIAYGVLMRTAGYGLGWAVFLSIVCYAGSMEFVTVTLLTSAFDPVQALVMSILVPPAGAERREFYFWITLLDYLYWLSGSAIGNLLGSVLPFDSAGMDFALTALFVVLFLEQWKKKENRPAGIIGLVCTALSLAVFGPDNLVIPAMVLLLAVLLGGRKKLCR